jgi:hypothetical protein
MVEEIAGEDEEVVDDLFSIFMCIDDSICAMNFLVTSEGDAIKYAYIHTYTCKKMIWAYDLFMYLQAMIYSDMNIYIYIYTHLYID